MKHFMVWILVSTLVAQLAYQPNARAQTSAPNIVVFMVDDLDVNTWQALLSFDKYSKLNLLPNFRKYILNKAVDFQESFVSNPICCPSRATFLTGLYSRNHQVFTNVLYNGSVPYMKEEQTLAVWLQAAGYRTIHVGKYLNGYGSLIMSPNLTSLQLGRYFIDKDIGYDKRKKMEPSHVPPGWSGWYGALDLSTYCMYNYTLNENGKIRSYLKNGEVRELAKVEDIFTKGGIYSASTPLSPLLGSGDNYQPVIYGRRAVDAINISHANNPNQPIFLSVMPLAPHVEVCEYTNIAYQGTPVEDIGPTLPLENYQAIMRGDIRPAPKFQPLYDYIYAATDTYIRHIAPDFTTAKPSFNEDISDKSPELQAKLLADGRTLPLLPEDIANLRHLMTNRMLALLSVDELIGKVMGRLEQLGRLSNTVVMFTSDNGYANGEHGLSSKNMAFEETAKVPLYVAYPGNTPRSCSKAVLNQDLTATILDIANVQPPAPLDGRSLIPVIADPVGAPWRKQILIEHFRGTAAGTGTDVVDFSNLFAVRTEPTSVVPRKKYVEMYDGMQFHKGYYLENQTDVNALGVPNGPPDGQWVWNGNRNFAELYDLADDKYETDNLLYNAEARPNYVEILQDQDRLRIKLHELLMCSGLSCQQAEDQD